MCLNMAHPCPAKLLQLALNAPARINADSPGSVAAYGTSEQKGFPLGPLTPVTQLTQ